MNIPHNTNETHQQTLDRYAGIYARLSPETLTDLKKVTTRNICFTDPFTTITGQDALCDYMGKMFEGAKGAKFTITHAMVCQEMGFLRWQFSAKVPVIGLWEFTGMSEVTFNTDGTLIATHKDHWDSGTEFYSKIPVLRWIIRQLAKKVAH